MNQLSVMMEVEFISPIIEFGVVNQYQFYGGPVELEAQDNSPSRVTSFTPVRL